MNISNYWHSSFDVITDLVSLHDKDYRILRVNKAFAEAFHVNQNEATGKRCYEFIHKTTSVIPECPCEQVLKTGKTVTKEIFSPVPELYLEIIAYPILGDNNEIEGILHYIKNITERKKLEQERGKLILDIQDAQSKIKQLSCLLPICSSCKKIRDDKSYWNQIESYMLGHSSAEFTSGICPECLKKFYPEHSEVQCWEYMKCGHELEKTCPVVLLDAGRMCWDISSTLCGGKRQGESFSKFHLCKECEFFIKLNRGEI